MVVANDLADTVDALAETTGCPIVVEDREFRVIAYSAVPGHVEDPVRNQAILRRRTPTAWLEWIERIPGGREQLASGKPIVVADAFPGLRRRMIKALRDESGVVGYVWVLEGGAGYPLSLEQDLLEFERRAGAEIARTTHRTSWSAEGRLVRALIGGAAGGEALAGVGVGPDWTVTASVVSSSEAGYADYEDLEKLSDVVRNAVRGSRTHVPLTGFGERGLVCRLDFHAERPSRPDLLRLERCVADAYRRLRRPIVMGVGSPARITALNTSWLQAQAAGQLLEGAGEGVSFATFDEVQARCVTAATADYLATRRELVDSLVTALEGPASGAVPDHRETITVFLEHNCSIPRTASALNLHPNSLRYRLRRIQRHLPVDLEDPVARLALQLAASVPR